MTGIASAREDFRPDIEGLRGVAILCVILYHIGWSVTEGGYIGVDMFFVLSGYLITGLLVSEAEQTGRIDFVRFYARRIRRLVPAATLVLLAVLVAMWLIYSPIERLGFGKSGLATALYVSNVRFALGSTNYLRAGSNRYDPLLHTWSLGVEEQFYLVWPFLVALVLLVASGRVASRRRPLLIFMGILAVGSLGLSLAMTRSQQSWAFFGLPTRAWQFAAGGIAAILQRRIAPFWGWLSIAAVVYSVTRLNELTPYPGIAAIAPTVATIGLLLSGLGDVTRGVSHYLAEPTMRWVGRVSYSWYLWHWPFITIGAVLLPSGGVAFRIGCSLAALVLAAATYKWLENPVRQSRALSARPFIAIGLGAVLISSSVGAALLFRRVAAVAMTTPVQRVILAAQRDFPAIDGKGCMLSNYATAQPECAFGARSAQSTIVLFGDSHAGEWFPAIEKVAANRGQRLLVRVRAECPAASLNVFSRIMRRRYPECDAWRKGVIREIVSLHPSLVFMSSSQRYLMRPGGPGGNDKGITADEWRAGFRVTLQQFEDAGIPVTVIRDTRSPGFDVPVCLSRAASARLWSRASCTYSINGASPITRVEDEATPEFRVAATLDLAKAICPSQPCRPEVGGLVVYRDSNHISASFSRSLASYFEAHIESRSP